MNCKWRTVGTQTNESEHVETAVQTEITLFEKELPRKWHVFTHYGPKSRKVSVSDDPLFFKTFNYKEFVRQIPANSYDISEYRVSDGTTSYNYSTEKTETNFFRHLVVRNSVHKCRLCLHVTIPEASWFNFRFMSESTMRIHLIAMWQRYVLHRY